MVSDTQLNSPPGQGSHRATPRFVICPQDAGLGSGLAPGDPAKCLSLPGEGGLRARARPGPCSTLG